MGEKKPYKSESVYQYWYNTHRIHGTGIFIYIHLVEFLVVD